MTTASAATEFSDPEEARRRRAAGGPATADRPPSDATEFSNPEEAQRRRGGETQVTAADRPAPERRVPLAERGPQPPYVVSAYGFWLFVLSDCIMFAAIFAAYAVLAGETAGGPGPRELFARGRVLLETFCLLASSFTCGLLTLAALSRDRRTIHLWGALTFALGAAFLALEIDEFAGMLEEGAGPTRSAFLSAFYMLVGTHGLHVAFGLVWLLVMLAQVATLGFRPPVIRRLLCFSIYWHALDIVWVALFTTVYLIGTS